MKTMIVFIEKWGCQRVKEGWKGLLFCPPPATSHACQKYFWKAEKSFFLPMHVPQCMAKRGKLKKVKKKKKKKKKNVLNNPKCSVGRHSNFSKQCQPALIYLILVPTSTRILKHSAGQHCVPKPPSALFLSFFQ